ncbi:MAG: hypothetical protein U1D97_14150, partial [Desulfuromonadales bacterium]|nr:hypothetical protein [Desulfuromonadales bacterium]
DNGFVPLIEWRIDKNPGNFFNGSPIINEMSELGISNDIPYCPKERKQTFKKAYRVLAQNIKYFQKEED